MQATTVWELLFPSEGLSSGRLSGEFLDLAHRADIGGILEWLSFYFKSPMTLPELCPKYDLFIQQMKPNNTLCAIMGQELITHLSLDYYE
jgi:myo-inositol-1-phosphate synthase